MIGRWGGWAVLAAVWVGLAVLVGWPLVRLAASIDARSLAVLLAWPTWEAFGNTLLVAIGTTLFATAAGVPLGLLVGRTDVPGAATLRSLLLVPYVVPPYVMAIGWIALLNPTTGWINVLLGTQIDIYGRSGMVFVMGLELAPVVVLATADAASRIDPALEEAARVAGASVLTTVRQVTVPLVLPAVADAAGLVIAATAAAFGVPYLLASGTSNPVPLLTTRIYQSLDLAPADGRPVALALAGLLLLAGLGLPALLRALAARLRVSTVGAKAAKPPILALDAWRWPAFAAIVLYLLIGAALPLAALLALSLMNNVGRGLQSDNIGLDTWIALLGRSEVREAIVRSLVIAAGAATLAVVVGTALSIVAARTDLPTRKAAMAVARAPYAVPGTVLALGMLLAWSQEIRVIVLERLTFTLALADTGWLLALAYATKWLAMPVGAADTGLSAIHPALEEAARISGAGPFATLRRITLPLLAPALLSAWLLVFLPATTEVTASVLLAGPDSKVVGSVLFQMQSYGDPPAAAALSVLVAAFALAGNAVFRGITWRT